MKKPYKIVNSENKIIVLPLSNNRLDELCLSVEKTLKKKNYLGKVLFDLLMSNGLTSNRFVSISFKTDKFDYSTIKEETKVDENTFDLSNAFYSKKRAIIDTSCLSRVEKQRIILFLDKYSLVEA
jgi:hypothetical protein